jgi:acetyltransferase, GNAT family
MKYDVFQAKSLPHCCQAASQARQLAADLHVQGQGFGSSLLADALFLQSKNKKTAGFYLHHGFIALPDTPLTLLLPLATVPDPLGTK